jgi:hypothetical protein
MKRAMLIVGALWVVGASSVLNAMDWSHPWQEPQSSVDAARSSDEYAWRVFVALNWPARRSSRADHAAAGAVPRVGADSTPDAATVWETWSSANDIFRPDGKDPGPWRPASVAPVVSMDSSRFEAFSARDLPNLQRVQNGKMVPVKDPLASATRLTEIHMNRAGYEYIRTRGLYNTNGQLRALDEHATVDFPVGAKEVKAKWRIITEAERSRYHTMTVKLADGTERLYGLTALHVVTKDLPTWFWATFEHVDNPQLPGNDGWQAPSRDTFACGRRSTQCDHAPQGIGLEGSVWENYRLRGTLTSFVDSNGQPRLLANSELEAGMQATASCVTCHSRAAIGVVDGQTVRLPIFDASVTDSQPDPHSKRGFIGTPRPEWFANGRFQSLDFIWSMAKARPQSP